MLSVQTEQRINLMFLVKLRKSFTEGYAILNEVYGNECLSHTQVFEWFKWFKEGRETTEDDPHPRRRSTSKTDENEKIDTVTLKGTSFESVETVKAKATVLKLLTEADF
ncbi:hypothetical protein NQ318_017751 [Aromia moschata]|uniref:Mos1 transposase HTH domain-containing protein n=1 Tax=Aromia moschata TaxID=1265417 RepID=A0AAV8YAN1_9CUCU|nr:hypothetical protein NQ318_017751 [Aromia moschata]